MLFVIVQPLTVWVRKMMITKCLLPFPFSEPERGPGAVRKQLLLSLMSLSLAEGFTSVEGCTGGTVATVLVPFTLSGTGEGNGNGTEVSKGTSRRGLWGRWCEGMWAVSREQVPSTGYTPLVLSQFSGLEL